VFVAVTGTDPWMPFEDVPGEPRDSRMVDANNVQARMQQVHELFRVEMQHSQDMIEEETNRNRLQAPQIQAGMKICLDARHNRTTRQSRKLDWKPLGGYKVTPRVSQYAFELELPRGLWIHPVHHISFWTPFQTICCQDS
jgi:hypothetical protein